VEGVANIGGMEARIDVEFDEVWPLRGGQTTLAVNGLINPRPDELRRNLQKYADHRTRTMQDFAQATMLRAATWRW
jgi:hypothetical protein